MPEGRAMTAAAEAIASQCYDMAQAYEIARKAVAAYLAAELRKTGEKAGERVTHVEIRDDGMIVYSVEPA